METPDNIKKMVINLELNYSEDRTLYNELRETYNFLIKKKKEHGKLKQTEFKFLFWLDYNNSEKFPITFNKPSLPEIIELSYIEFRDQYVTNDYKLDIWGNLKEFLSAKFNDEVLDLLIGGSFLEKNNMVPRDIDCVILLPEKIISFAPWICNDEIARENEFATELIDAHYLPNNYSLTNYSTYVNIMMLGNMPEIKDKQLLEIENNTFKKREVVKIRFQKTPSTYSNQVNTNETS
jgi:hypothetical protein